MSPDEAVGWSCQSALTRTSIGDAPWSGDIFVWTHDGRPQLIGCVGSWPIDESTPGIFEELRLLTQPMYRYSGESKTVIDGAIFAYVTTTGTDPEVLLLLICHKDGDKLKWVYSPVNRND